MTRKPSDYRELKEYLKENEPVTKLELDRRMVGAGEYTDLYLHFYCSLAGINYWGLHEEFDVDVVHSWHDPTVDKLSVGLRLRE